MRVLIVVTHLLGTGHLSRALTLGRAFADAGHDCWLVSGGMPVPHLDLDGVRLVQLPPLRSDGTNFARLLDQTGAPADPALMAARETLLLKTLDDTAPHIAVTELFPFGRRVLKTEFRAFVDACHARVPRPVVLTSIRDILAPPSKPARAEETIDTVTTRYDAVLVHSDPSVITLDASWPVPDALREHLVYTGFVAPAAAGPHPRALGAGEVIVSAGGGAVGDRLFETALAAARNDPGRPWRILVGGGPARVAALAATAPPNATVEPPRRDFRQMLGHAACSVSMCGYNTALDILQSGVPAVLVPFDDGGEVEQTLRAGALSRLPSISVLRAGDLTATSLTASVASVAGKPWLLETPPRMDGAAETVRIAEQLARERA